MVAAAALAAGSLTALTATPSDAVTVPNMYHCSRQTNQCWQTNPPHVASIINQCYWYNDVVRNAAYAPDTCGKYTSH